MDVQPKTSLELEADRVLRVQDLSVQFRTSERVVDAVKHLSFHVDRGETLAIVGESGSGKSVTSLALMRLLRHGGGRILNGELLLRRRGGHVLDLARAASAQLRSVRGSDMAMIFQEPMTSLNPIFTVGGQIAESLILHRGVSGRAARAEVLRLLDQVRIPDAKSVVGRYPHQLSGGMRQRVMIAMALACRPVLLIADEPTTALDVTIQAQILQLIRELQRDMRMGVIFITHDMGVVAEIADRVLVMLRGGRIETGPAQQIFDHPAHPYTRALLAAVPKLGAMQGTEQPARFPLVDAAAVMPHDAGAPEPIEVGLVATQDDAPSGAEPVLRVRDLVTRFDIRSGLFGRVTHRVHAVEKVSFDLYPGETLGLVGESGCGKSTTGRALLKLVDSQAGDIEFEGRKLGTLKGAALQALRRNVQFIFQDPFASLDPRVVIIPLNRSEFE